MFETTRDVWAQQKTNAALDRLDRDLAEARRWWGTAEKPAAGDAMLWMGLALAVATADLEKVERFTAAGRAVTS